MAKEHIKLDGKIFGQWTVIERDLVKTNTKSIFYKVKCSCGNYGSVDKKFLLKGLSKKCKSCFLVGTKSNKTNNRKMTKEELEILPLRSINRYRTEKILKGKFLGVKEVPNNKYAAICYKKHLGTFDNAVEAAKAYDKVAFENHKELALLNFPEDYADE